METRLNKYCTENIESNDTSFSTRSSRNAKLYRNVYGKYDDLDNLPIEDNTNEIDMASLKELVSKNSVVEVEREISDNLNILEQRKRRIDEQKLYDINKILEKAKYENSKLKEPVVMQNKVQNDLLFTLQGANLSVRDVDEAKKHYEEQNDDHKTSSTEDNLSMTREFKYKNLSLELQENKEENKSAVDVDDLSLDLFAELKSTGNTIITEPVNKNIIKNDIRSGDTSDIDIIKGSPNATTNDFFTNSYEFSKKDFAEIEEDDFFDTPKKGGLFKILLLVLAIIVFVGVIIYFIGTYGLGIS